MTNPEPALALRGVHRTYGRGAAAVRALDGVDLDLEALLGAVGTALPLRAVLRARPADAVGVRE